MNENTQQNADSTSTPANATPAAPTAAAIETSVMLPAYPRIVDTIERVPVKFGDKAETLPISVNEKVSIDSYMFVSPTNFRLKNVKTVVAALKKGGHKQTDGTAIDAKWFNTNVRDPFHKVLKYAAKHSLEHGQPVSLAFTRRTVKATGEQIVTAKHAFEHVTNAPAAKQVEQQVAARTARQSANRARRQNRRNKPLASVGEAMQSAERVNALNVETPAPATA